MHYHNELGKLVKEKRLNKKLTRQKLAEKIGVGTRHIFSIEHEGGNPSYKVLRELVYTLEIPPDEVFYPQNADTDTELKKLIKLIRLCDEHQLTILRATVEAMLHNDSKQFNKNT